MLVEDRGTPIARAANTTVDLELNRAYLQHTIQELSIPVPNSSGVWPEGGLEVTSIDLGDSDRASMPLPSASLEIHFHPMTGTGAKAPVSIRNLNYTIRATLVPYRVDGGVVLKLALDSVYSNSGNKEIARKDKGSRTLSCFDPINIVDEKIINGVNNSFILKDTMFPMPSQQILDVVAGMSGSSPNLSGFAVTTNGNGLRAGFQFDVEGNIGFEDQPLLIGQFFSGEADWGIRISSTFINEQIRKTVKARMKNENVTMTGLETRYKERGIDIVAAGVSNSGQCHIFATLTATPVIRMDNLGHRLVTSTTEPKMSTGPGEGLCALFNILVPGWLMGHADMVINGGGPSGGCKGAVGGVLDFAPFALEDTRPHLASQRLYASDVATSDLATEDPNDGIFLVGGRVSTLDEERAKKGKPVPEIPRC